MERNQRRWMSVLADLLTILYIVVWFLLLVLRVI